MSLSSLSLRLPPKFVAIRPPSALFFRFLLTTLIHDVADPDSSHTSVILESQAPTGGGAAENKRSIEVDGKKTKKVLFAKKLKIAKAYVAKIKKQAVEKDSDDDS